MIFESEFDGPFGDFDLSSVEDIQPIDHQEGAVSRLVQQFQKPRFRALVRRLTATMQDVENAAVELLLMRRIELATGDLLDKFGAIVKRLRGELDDDTYRRYIKAEIRTRRSHGLPLDLTAICRLVVADELAFFNTIIWGNAALSIEVLDTALDFAVSVVLIGFLERAVASGVRIYLEWLTDDPSESFCFEAFVPGEEVGKGFLSFDETEGGALGSVLRGA